MGPAVTVGPLQDYLQRVGALNAKAAIYGGISVLLSTLWGNCRELWLMPRPGSGVNGSESNQHEGAK
jgi:hypothetical protein